jgi:hypothetical protein
MTPPMRWRLRFAMRIILSLLRFDFLIKPARAPQLMAGSPGSLFTIRTLVESVRSALWREPRSVKACVALERKPIVR